MKLFLLLIGLLVFISCNNKSGEEKNFNPSKKMGIEYKPAGVTICRDDPEINKEYKDFKPYTIMFLCHDNEFIFRSKKLIIDKNDLDNLTKQTFTEGITGEFSFNNDLEEIDFTAKQMTEKLVYAIKKITTQRSKDIFEEKLPEINTTPIEAFKSIDFDKLRASDFH